MKNSLLIILAVVVVLIIGVVSYLAFVHPNTSSQSGTSGTYFPNSGSSGGSGAGSTGSSGNSSSGTGSVMTIKEANGSSVAVKNFVTASSTVEAPGNSGVYYLAGGVFESTSHAPYQIFFNMIDDSFGITLYDEPLGEYRQQAEQQLMNQLGLSQSQMCNLTYYLSAGPGISDIYSSENLGFSFCPGAVQLPQ